MKICEGLPSNLPPNHCLLRVCQRRARTVRASIVLGRNKETTTSKRTMNHRINSIKTHVVAKRFRAAGLSDEKSSEPIQTTGSEGNRESYGNITDAKITII